MNASVFVHSAQIMKTWMSGAVFFFSYSRYVSQSASGEAFGQNALKVCRPLNGKQEQLHLNLLSPRSHDFSKLHPWKTQKTFRFDYIPVSTPNPKQISLLEMAPINMLSNTVALFFWTRQRRKPER